MRPKCIIVSRPGSLASEHYNGPTLITIEQGLDLMSHPSSKSQISLMPAISATDINPCLNGKCAIHDRPSGLRIIQRELEHNQISINQNTQSLVSVGKGENLT